MERKCPSLLHIGNILLTVAALYCGGLYFTFRRNVDSNIYSIYDRSCLVADRKCEKLCTYRKKHMMKM